MLRNLPGPNNNNDIRKKIEDYSYGLNDKIGKGFSSVVFRGMNQRTEEPVGIKVIDLKTVNKDKLSKQMLEGQIEALRRLNHPNILRCHDIYTTVNNCYIITEFCNGGDLSNLLQKRNRLSEEETIPIFRNIFMGFMHLAEEGFLHRDLKPSNIMMKDNIAKIGDFGFTKKVSGNSFCKQTFNVGSPLYMSPQALQKNHYSFKNDIWSLGIILYQMIHGRTPWQSAGEKELLEKMQTVSISLMRTLSEDLKDFIRQCLLVSQEKRLGLEDISNHAFIKRIMMEGDIPKLLRKATSIENNSNRCLQNEDKFKISSKHLQPIYKQGGNLNGHRNSQGNGLARAQKQLQTQINWMRFLYRLNQMFPCVSKSSPSIIGLRFIICKQMLSQLKSLQQCMAAGKQNVFNFDNWVQFLAETERIRKYQQVIPEYIKKYQKIQSTMKEWIKIAALQKKLTTIADKNLQRSQLLSILAVSCSVQYIKTLWEEAKRQTMELTEQDLPEELLKTYHRLDFLISYYQLNCLLLDNFHDPDYFTRLSKIDHMIEYKPATLQRGHFRDLENKIHLLGIDK